MIGTEARITVAVVRAVAAEVAEIAAGTIYTHIRVMINKKKQAVCESM